MTAHGQRVAVYLDARLAERGEDWDQGLAAGLLHSLCFLPLLSYGYTAPLASLGGGAGSAGAAGEGWAETPLGLRRLLGDEDDDEDGVLKAYLRRRAGGGRVEYYALLNVTV